MNKKQKRILIIFGLLDIIAISLMVSVVIKNLTQNAPASPTTQATQISPCAQDILKQLSIYTNPAVVWDDTQLSLAFTMTYSQPIPPKDSVQYLWIGLDTIANTAKETCPPPPLIIITATAKGTVETHHHTAQLTGTDVVAWFEGELAENQLAEQTRYRQVITTQQE